MPFNGSGTYSRLYSWAVDAVNNVNISSSRTDAEMNGFAAGLTNCVTRDGQSPPSADLPMGGKKLVNLGNATVGTDALNMATGDARYVQTSGTANITITGTFGGSALSLSGNATIGGTVAVTGLLTANGNVRINGTGGASALIVDDHTSGSGANIQLVGNGATTPNKTMRVVSGVYQIVNSAYASVLWSLDDSGNATFTGTATGLTASPGDNSTKFSTTAYVLNALVSYAPLASPAFTGTVTANGGISSSGALSLTGALTPGTSVNCPGYLGAPSSVKTANYSLATTDIGQDITFNGTTLTCTIPAGLPNGYVAIIANINASALTITSASDTLTLSGTTTTGNRTLGQNGEARIIRRNGVLYIAGTALS